MATFPKPNVKQALQNPTVQETDSRGYTYDSTSPVWKLACAPLPSCSALQWPGYETTAIEAQLNGQDVVIQPWMGHCQQFFGRSRFPGGFGGEVGVYVRSKRGRAVPDSEILPKWTKAMFDGLSLLGGDKLWWPDAGMQPEIEFTIINPLDNSILVRSAKEKNYWANKWMQPQSFEKYKQDHHVPGSPTRYKMVFTVGGVTRTWMPSPTEA